ncbi:MAG: tetratricopeptide repeat protein [Pseudomonadota bacterium]
MRDLRSRPKSGRSWLSKALRAVVPLVIASIAAAGAAITAYAESFPFWVIIASGVLTWLGTWLAVWWGMTALAKDPAEQKPGLAEADSEFEHNESKKKIRQESDIDGHQNVAPQIVGDHAKVTINQLAPSPAPSIDPPSSQARLHALPARNPDFVGRQEDMAKIRGALDQGGAVITALEGMGGIGKTAVGIEVANALRDEGLFLGGVPFVDLEGFSATRDPLTTKEALEALLRPIVGSEAKLPDDDGRLQQLWKQTTADRQMLLFLDNARDEAQIRPLLPGHPSCKVLATSRNRLDLDGITPIRLDVMEPDEATDLAYTLGNRWQKGRVSRAQAGELARLCGYLPLPIKVTAASLGKAKLLDADAQLAKLADVGRDALGMDEVKAVLALSIDQLTPELRAAWQKLGVFEGDFSVAAAAAVLNEGNARDLLDELEQRHLVTLSEQQRLHLHDILRAMALESLAADEREAADARHAAHYKDVLASADDLYLEGKVLDGLRLYDQEQHQIQAGQRWGMTRLDRSNEAARLAADYADAGVYILQLRLTPRQVIVWLETQRDACRALEDRRGEGTALGNLGIAYQKLGETKRAIDFYEQHLEIARGIGDRRGEGNALGNLGNAYQTLGETKRAIEFHEQSLEVLREIGDRRGEGNTLGNLGSAYQDLGEMKRAIDTLEQRLEIAREIGDRRGEGNALGNLGSAYRNLGEAKRAIEFHEQALAISYEIGLRLAEGQDLTNLGVAYQDLGETKRAINSLEEAQSIFREIGAQHLIDLTERNLSQLRGSSATE